MLNIQKLRQTKPYIISLGSYPSILQSILDFDFLSGKHEPSIIAIIAGGRKNERYFFGKMEIFIPVYPSLDAVPSEKKDLCNFVINVSSARRVFSSTTDALEKLPSLFGITIFAEDVPEKQSIELYQRVKTSGKFLIGPASVGLIIPAVLKLGAIGGVDYKQLIDSALLEKGNIAVLSASGGMTNEIIRIVAQANKRVSFSLSFGGDRFPILSPRNAFLAAENDPDTTTIAYYGELGGFDEYEIAKLLEEKRITKEVICYIAGTIADLFETPPQFGHAKAMAQTNLETAKAKREALKKAGAKVATTFSEFVEFIKNCSAQIATGKKEYTSHMEALKNRRTGLIASSVSYDVDGNLTVLGEDLLAFVENNSFASIAVSMFLGRKIKSKDLEKFIDFVLRLLVDHGPYVSGAVNTIITARAGRDLVSSLSAGLLTIGPRFGGAINQAAGNWLAGVLQTRTPSDFVEEFAKKKTYIPGIGHKKYRVDQPDPRVKEILAFTTSLKEKRFTEFAKQVESITVAKKGNLILNVDGAIAAVLLDILSEKEGLSETELQQLVSIEFFNAIFVASRSIGFIAHFLDQKRLDEGLFRLDEDLVTEVKIDK